MEFKLLHNIVKNIQDTIYNTGRDSVSALKAHTYPTRVTNFPKVQKINGIVSVSNQKRVEKELIQGNVLQKSVLKLIRGFKFPTSINVDNFPVASKQLPYPKEIKVNNFPKQKEYPKNIRVSNQPTKEIKALGKDLQTVVEAVKALKLSPTIKVASPKAERLVVPPANVSVTQQEIDYEKLASLMPAPAKEIDYKKLSEAIAKEIAASIVTVGGGGGKRKEGLDDLTRSYNVADKDTDGTTKYYGFTGRAGDWYILRENTTTDEYRYVKGSSSYSTNWTGRAGLTFGYYHEIF